MFLVAQLGSEYSSSKDHIPSSCSCLACLQPLNALSNTEIDTIILSILQVWN